MTTKKRKPSRALGSLRATPRPRATAPTARESRDRYPLGPVNVSTNDWLYVEREGVCVVHQVTSKVGAVLKTDQFYLPWPIVWRVLAIRDKKKQPRKSAK